MQDCANVMNFLRSEEFGKATEGKVDQSKICISGGSAGMGFLLLSGLLA